MGQWRLVIEAHKAFKVCVPEWRRLPSRVLVVRLFGATRDVSKTQPNQVPNLAQAVITGVGVTATDTDMPFVNRVHEVWRLFEVYANTTSRFIPSRKPPQTSVSLASFIVSNTLAPARRRSGNSLGDSWRKGCWRNMGRAT
jgi:hypothetical protein